ncbi:MAG: DUF5683 domain-containing protein [Bacteroidota bacterium]|nr:DUF5683 domain-containing protein [Bacteroidota bacterium]
MVTAQSDTSAQTEVSKPSHSPKRATTLSIMLPGAGQAYNRSYWKIPVIYAGYGALAYSLWFNQSEYKRFGDYYKLAADDDPNTNPEFPGSAQQLRLKRNLYKKRRDLTLIGMAGLYALQILDAHVDAHLKQFDISNDLSIRWSPDFNYHAPSAQFASGLRLHLVF